jgi:hypothetical protein
MKNRLLVGLLLSLSSISAFSQAQPGLTGFKPVEFTFTKLKKVKVLSSGLVAEGEGVMHNNHWYQTSPYPGAQLITQAIELRISDVALTDQEAHGFRPMFSKFLSLGVLNANSNVLHCRLYTSADQGFNNTALAGLFGAHSNVVVDSASSKTTISLISGAYGALNFCELGPNKIKSIRPEEADTFEATEQSQE